MTQFREALNYYKVFGSAQADTGQWVFSRVGLAMRLNRIFPGLFIFCVDDEIGAVQHIHLLAVGSFIDARSGGRARLAEFLYYIPHTAGIPNGKLADFPHLNAP